MLHIYAHLQPPVVTLINKCNSQLPLILNGLFKNAEASKALFKLRSLLNDPHISLDQLIKPIALYGSGLQGPDVIKCVIDDPNKYFNCLSKFIAEELNMSIARFVLGVHKKAPNSAVLGKLGCYPLGLAITANTILYKVMPLRKLFYAIVHTGLGRVGKGRQHPTVCLWK